MCLRPAQKSSTPEVGGGGPSSNTFLVFTRVLTWEWGVPGSMTLWMGLSQTPEIENGGRASLSLFVLWDNSVHGVMVSELGPPPTPDGGRCRIRP